MYGSCVRTGTGIIHLTMLLILKGLFLARTGCVVVGAGAAAPGTAGRHFAAATRLAAGATTWASALPGHIKFWFFTFLPFGGRELTPKESQVDGLFVYLNQYTMTCTENRHKENITY